MVKKCQKCGQENSDDAQFCEECGQTLNGNESNSDYSSKNKGLVVCQNCGTENAGDNSFCEKCGNRLDSVIEVTDDAESNHEEKYTSKSESRADQTPTTKPINKHAVIIGTIIVAILLGVFGIYRYGENYYSYENQVSRLKDTVASKSAEKIVNNMISEDEQFEVTEKSLKPFVDYLKTDSDYLANTIDQMEFGAMGNNDVYVTQSGKHLLFYDKYVLAIKPTYFAVHTNLTGMLLSVNGEDQDTSNSDDYTWKVGPVSPGQYSFKGTFEDTNGEESTIEDTVIQIYQQELNENDERLVSLEATKVKFDLVADIPNGEIFVDGKSVGQLKDGRLDGINYIWHDGSTLTIKQKIGDLELESQNIEIDPYSYSDSSYGAFSELSVSVIPVAIYSNMVGADIKIDGKKVATVGEDSEVKFNLVMPEEDHELVAVQSFEDGEITSQKEKISPVSVSYYYDLSSESRKDAFDFSTWLSDLYFSISDFADDDYDFGEDEIKALADYFVGGKDNKEFIDFKDAFIGETRENDKIRYIQTSLGEVEKVTAVGAKDYEVQYTVNYYTVYTDSTASVDETFRYKKATFSVEDGELKIKDLGGKDSFEKVE